MAKVSLRIYNREIESLIDQGHLDEAIAHCHHILQTFPKHLETYRLLGKSYLEAKRYNEAVDIFSRVLMAVPDDFVSHVGMSIIRDDEGKLDDAIWHMERAFESQPSNAAIQNELQRLYGRRDGVAPPKIRMTRGALAHMYVQGELYPQAISEIRSVLSQDPQRADMQVLLARAYFRGGQKADASDMCAQLLKRYVYCFDANRIMVELIPASDRAESTQVYRHRVNELDPYSTFAKESVFQSDEVPDAAVNLERLEYTGQTVEPTPDWGSSLGIALGSETQISDEPPDWLKAGLSEPREDASNLQKIEEETSLQELASTLDAQPASQGDSDIPDFLRAAGWTESSGAREEPAQFEPSSEEDLAPADIPDWLKSQMPAEPAQEPKPSAPAADVPDWLSGLGSIGSSAEATDKTASEVPDWLDDLDKDQSTQPTAEPESKPGDESLPDWLSPESELEDLPAPEAVEPEEEFSKPVTLETLGTTAKEQDDAVAWLEMLAAKHGAKPEELVTDPNARTEKPPEWVEQAKSLAESQPAEQAPASEPDLDQTGIWLSGLGEKEAPSPAGEAEGLTTSDLEVPDWLSGLESKAVTEASEEEPLAQAEVPDWLSGLNKEPAAQPLEEATPSQSPDLPDWMSGIQPETAAVQGETEESMPEGQADSEWLGEIDKELPEQKPVSEPITQPLAEQRTEVPDWLQDLEAEPAERTEERAEELPVEQVSPSLSEEEESFDQILPSMLPETPVAEELPEWLRGVDETRAEEVEEEQFTPSALEAEDAAPVLPAADELPEWLRGVDETRPEEVEEEQFTPSALEAEEPAPTTPVEAELPEWMRGVDVAKPEEVEGEQFTPSALEAEEPAPVTRAAEELPEWLRGMDETRPEEVEEEQFTPPASEAEEPVPVTPVAAEWVQEIEETESKELLEEDVTPLPSETKEPAPSQMAAADLPEWLRGLDEARPEETPAEEADSLPAWLKSDLEEEAPHPSPVSSTDWHPAEPEAEVPAETPEPEFQMTQPPQPEPVVSPVEMERAVSASDVQKGELPPEKKPVRAARVKPVGEPAQATVAALGQAKVELNRGDIPAAMDHYNKLIKKGKYLNETISDLRESLYRYPVEVNIWQTLGDAYLRANRLQEALDAYNKAEELLR